MHYLVLDIETVRDERTWQPPPPPPPWQLHIGGIYDSQYGSARPPTPDHFAPPYGWRPIVIGCVLLKRSADNTPITVERVGAIVPVGDDDDSRERSLLEQFAAFVSGRNLTLVTWNGRHFDLPVLLLRSLRYGIGHNWFYGNRDARYRYTEDGHCDLMDAMSDHGAATRLHLDGMAKLVGLPGKFGDIDGAGVEEAYRAGRLADIAAYCLSDTVQTAFLWLRWLVLKEFIRVEEYRQTAIALLEIAAGAPGLKALVDQVDRRVLLLEPHAPAKAA